MRTFWTTLVLAGPLKTASIFQQTPQANLKVDSQESHKFVALLQQSLETVTQSTQTQVPSVTLPQQPVTGSLFPFDHQLFRGFVCFAPKGLVCELPIYTLLSVRHFTNLYLRHPWLLLLLLPHLSAFPSVGRNLDD